MGSWHDDSWWGSAMGCWVPVRVSWGVAAWAATGGRVKFPTPCTGSVGHECSFHKYHIDHPTLPHHAIVMK